MTTTCKNCDHHFKGKFCNNCGQSAETHEINFHFLLHDIKHGLFHVDNGILYTLKQLFTRPGYSIREFIGGKRVRHFKPVSLVIILATFYGFLYYNFHINYTDDVQTNDTTNVIKSIKVFNQIWEWAFSHYSLIELLLLPVYALGSFIVFKKQKHNYLEHLIMNAFLAGQRLIIDIVTFPLLYIYNETPTLDLIGGILIFVDFVLLYWGYSQFFDKVNKFKVFFLSLLACLIFIFCLILLTTLLVIIAIIVAKY